jgi:hypothetical protein
MELNLFMRIVATKLGKTEEEILPYVEILNREWIKKVDDLRLITD